MSDSLIDFSNSSSMGRAASKDSHRDFRIKNNTTSNRAPNN